MIAAPGAFKQFHISKKRTVITNFFTILCVTDYANAGSTISGDNS